MHRQNKNNTPQYVLVAFALVAVTVTYNYFKNIQLEKRSKMQAATKAEEVLKEVRKEPQSPSRKVASIPTQTSVIKKYKDRKIVGTFKADKDFPITNKVNKEWKQLAFNKLNRYLKDDTKMTIEPVKSAIFVKHNIGRYVEHVKIIFKKENGLVSAYDAYIDSQSGNVIRTWNRTKIEYRDNYKFSSKGKGVFSLPLEKQEAKASL